MRLITQIFILWTFVVFISCEVIDVNIDEVTKTDTNFKVIAAHMFSSSDVPLLAVGQSSITFNLTGSSDIDVILYSYKDADKRPKCAEGGVKVSDETVLKMKLPILKTIPIKDTKLFYIYIMRCSGKQELKANVQGKITLMNPYGHLQGQQLGSWMFHALLSVIYISVCVFWLLLTCVFRKDFLTLQFCITQVLMLCTLESVVLYFGSYYDNTYGQRALTMTVSGVVLTIARKSVARVLVLIVCMGYGTSKPSLSARTWSWMIVVGILYCITCLIYEVAEYLSDMNALEDAWKQIANLPVSLIDIVFYLWIVYSLWSTMNDLKN
ncbi:5 TM domain-containing transmembrane protein [Acrasis kona]|uniref:5 TM domain-containing transmembrane protein n=1 Tax=Acrasis kona TaxID=1008807 RepID=A0AAW2ZNU0_9EUKA